MFPQFNQGTVQQECLNLRISSTDLGRSRLVPSVFLIAKETLFQLSSRLYFVLLQWLFRFFNGPFQAFFVPSDVVRRNDHAYNNIL